MKPKKILIILLGALGDVVRGLHIADALKSWEPKIHIDWLVEPKCQGIVELSPSVDRVLVFDRRTPLSSILKLKKLFQDYDYCLDMQRHFKSGLLSWLSGSKLRIGFNPKNTKEFNHFFNNDYIAKVSNQTNKFYHYQEFLKKIGCPVPVTTTTKLYLKDFELPHEFQKNYVFCVLGSSWESKNWVLEGYFWSIKYLLEDKQKVILIGTKDQTELSLKLLEQLSSKTNFNNLLNLVGKTDLNQLVSIISLAKFGFGPDSGPGHIASALGVKYISLFGPTDPKRVCPIGQEQLVISSAIGCSGCGYRVCPGLDKLCMRMINVNNLIDRFNILNEKRVKELIN